ncbi:MAG TPA: hypothetical protein VIH99_07545 [Bdellovibrionota bacterium]|jgi:hypothetical protein
MKRNFFLLAFVAFSPLHAFGDFVPGRVRTSAQADLQSERSDGRYKGRHSAQLFQLKTDGKGITGFNFKLDSNASVHFAVVETQTSRCGPIYVAKTEDRGRVVLMKIRETLPSLCREERNAEWRVLLTADESPNETSHLLMAGVPEFFLLSQ